MNFYRLSLAILPSFLLLVSCGGGGGGGGNPGGSVGTETELTGVFVDSTVQGISFSTASRSGTTNAAGEFNYLNGEQVTFSIGGIVLGQVTGTSLVTPVSLVAGASDETNEVVTNIAQLLQTLDDDGNPDNGISIPGSVTSAAQDDAADMTSPTFDTDIVGVIAELTTLTSSGQRALVSETAAQSHLQTNLQNLISGSYSGTYSGTFTDSESSGPSSGTWELVIDDQGNISGQASDGEGGIEPFSGKVNSNGSGATGGSDTGVSFSLSINAGGNVSGNWNASDPDDPSFSASGSLSGSKLQSGGSGSAGGNLIPAGEVAATGETSWPPATVAQILDQHFTDGVATPFTAPLLDTEGDQDWWSFSGEANTFFFFIKTGADHQANDLTDMACVVDIFDQNGNKKAYIDPISSSVYSADDGFHKNCEVIFTPPDANTYYLRVRASDAYSVRTGSYSLYSTKDEHPRFSPTSNQSKSYSFDVKVLNRRYELSRVVQMPDVRTIGNFHSITNHTISGASSTVDSPLIVYNDTDGNLVVDGRVGNYRLDLFAGPMFISFSAIDGYSYNLYDWSAIPTVNITITNPNPLPNYDPQYPLCAENTSRLTCENAGNLGKPYLFHEYSSGFTGSVPLNQTCANYGYSSPSSISTGAGPTAGSPAVGTCLYQPSWLTY